MKTERLEVNDGHRIHDHGEICLFRDNPLALESAVKIEADLVIAPENFGELKEELEKLIAKYAL